MSKYHPLHLSEKHHTDPVLSALQMDRRSPPSTFQCKCQHAGRGANDDSRSNQHNDVIAYSK